MAGGPQSTRGATATLKLPEPGQLINIEDRWHRDASFRDGQARARAAQADPHTPEPDPNFMTGYDDRQMDDDMARFLLLPEDYAVWLAGPVAAHPKWRH